MATQGVNWLKNKYEEFHLDFHPAKTFGVITASNNEYTDKTGPKVPAGSFKGAFYLLTYEWDVQNIHDLDDYKIHFKETVTDFSIIDNTFLPPNFPKWGHFDISGAKDFCTSFDLAKQSKTTRIIHVDGPGWVNSVKQLGPNMPKEVLPSRAYCGLEKSGHGSHS